MNGIKKVIVIEAASMAAYIMVNKLVRRQFRKHSK